MYVILVCHRPDQHQASIHLVDEQGGLVHSERNVQNMLRHLWQQGEREVVAMTDVGPELFLIEECDGLTMVLPTLAMRRAFHGRCADLPAFLGEGPDPTLRARVLADAADEARAKRRSRQRWVRRATVPDRIAPANDNRGPPEAPKPT